MITLKPLSGLANRMRAMDSIFALTNDSDKKIKIIWQCDYMLNCEFEKLFIAPKHIEIDSIKLPTSIFLQKLLKKTYSILRSVKINVPFGYIKYIYQQDIPTLINEDYDFKELLSINKVFIESHSRFYPGDESFQSFIPIPELQQRINAIIANFNSNTIGIHIRRGDNIKSIVESPLDGFIEQMQYEICMDPNVLFFLATDSPETEQRLHDLFPNKILSCKKSLNRNSCEGIQDALIDLMCLSNTRKIFGSFWSSFSETAAAIGKIELKIIQKAK